MAQDIRYPWVRVREACGPQLGLYPRVKGRKNYAYRKHYGVERLNIATHVMPIAFTRDAFKSSISLTPKEQE